MTRASLLLAVPLVACVVKPTVFGSDIDDASADGDPDAADDDAEAMNGEWVREIDEGSALRLDAQRGVAVLRSYHIARVSASGDLIEDIPVDSAYYSFAWGEPTTLMGSVVPNGYELRRLTDGMVDGYSYVSRPVWATSEVRHAADGTARVLGLEYDDGQAAWVAFVDIFAADGSLAATWSQTYDNVTPSSSYLISLVGEDPDGSMVVWAPSYTGEGHTIPGGSTTGGGFLSRFDAGGAALASMVLPPTSVGELMIAVVRHPEGWMAIAENDDGLWTQTIAADLSELGERRIVDPEFDGFAQDVATIQDGVLVASAIDGIDLTIDHYGWDGAHIGSTPIERVNPDAASQLVIELLGDGDAAYLLTSEEPTYDPNAEASRSVLRRLTF